LVPTASVVGLQSKEPTDLPVGLQSKEPMDLPVGLQLKEPTDLPSVLPLQSLFKLFFPASYRIPNFGLTIQLSRKEKL
jgi:hypothetical protein